MTGTPARLLLTRWVIAGCVLLGATACTKAATSAEPTPSSAPAASSAGLGGGNGEQSSAAPRSTILTTPTPKLTTTGGAQEVDGTCPYISNADFQEYEGDRVGRVTIIETRPVGCRFYFSYQPDQIIGEVYLQTFPDAISANNAMVASSNGHPERQSSTTIGDGAIAYRTVLQGESTWQCVVTVGNRVYTVRTRQTYPAQDAFNLASAVVATVRPG